MKRDLVFATSNPAKLSLMAELLAELDCRLLSLSDFTGIAQVEENGITIEENAQIKALHAHQTTSLPAFATDASLSIRGLDPALQPGLFVRRDKANRRDRSDAEMVAHYQAIFAPLGKNISGDWSFAICLANQGRILKTQTVHSAASFLLPPSQHITPGEPLNSFQFDPLHGKFVSELSAKENIARMGLRAEAFLRFLEDAPIWD